MNHSQFEMLLAFCDAVEWAADPEMVYQRIVDTSSEYFECDSAHLHLLDIDGKRFVRHASHNDQDVAVYLQSPISRNVGRMGNMLNTGDLIVMDYLKPDEKDVIPDEAIRVGYRSAVSIPLNSSSGILGMLSIVYKSELPWLEDDYGFLIEIGRVLGTFIQRIQMSKKELELQMLKERKQLSSEIHDNVSQMVSALAIRADIALACLEDGDNIALEDELNALGSQARQVTKVLREEMLALRLPIEGAGDVCEDVRGMLARFEEQWGIAARLLVRHPEEMVVSEYVRLQLVRIVNECLQNILRHSRASEVEVLLDRRNGQVLISVRDNGIGFDIASVAPERLGIRIMRERAVSAGGALSVVSGVQGTTVFIEMPAGRS